MPQTAEWRVVVDTQTAPVDPKPFPDRVAAESYRERLRGIVRNPARVQVRSPGGSWVDAGEEQS